jgi:uncharacterized beta-barrel protein YwiB (DUF1934 family)
MMTIATIKKAETSEIDFDMDDSGHYYLKQDDDWIALNEQQLSALSRAILDQLGRL